MKRPLCFLLSVLILSSCATQALAFYHPDEGRWISRDPIGEQGGNNLYGYIRNDSLNYLDDRGLVLATIGLSYSERQPPNRFVTAPNASAKCECLNFGQYYLQCVITANIVLYYLSAEHFSPNDPFLNWDKFMKHEHARVGQIITFMMGQKASLAAYEKGYCPEDKCNKVRTEALSSFENAYFSFKERNNDQHTAPIGSQEEQDAWNVYMDWWMQGAPATTW